MKDSIKETFTVKGVTFNLVKVEGGKFIMGVQDKQSKDFVDFMCKKETDRVRLFNFEGVEGVLKTLYDPCSGMLIFTYYGSDSLMLDDVVIQEGIGYEWPLNKVLKSKNGKQISFSTIVDSYLENQLDEDNRDEARANEYPAHQVTLSSFMIGETEVTQDLWMAVMGKNPSRFKGDKRPVENVSWLDCQTFIEKLNQLTGQKFRFPTEAEWEFAARGGLHGHYYKYPGGNGVKEGSKDNIDDLGWYADNSGDETHEVGQKLPNELGLYDMVGNVMEWCADFYDLYPKIHKCPTGGLVNPKGPDSGKEHVLRGGCWFNYAIHCRTTMRVSLGPKEHCDAFGLRLAL